MVPTAFITRYHVIKTKKETRPFPKIESQKAEFQGKKNEVDPGSEPDWDGPEGPSSTKSGGATATGPELVAAGGN